MNVLLFRDLPVEAFKSMEVYADELACALEQCAPRDAISQFAVPRMPISPSKLRVMLAKFVFYPRLAQRARADVYHVVDQSYGHLVPALTPERTVVTCHDLMPLEIEHGVVPATKRLRLGVWLAQHSYSGMTRAAHIIADSRATHASIEKYLGYDGKISVIYPGVAPSYRFLSEQERDAAAARFQMNEPGAFYILHVGGVAPYKNVEGVLKAVAHLVQEFNVNAYLVKVGQEFTPLQRQLITCSGLESRVMHLGALSNEDLCGVYNAAHLLFFPSHHEGYGLPVAEALRCGTPVLISTAPSLLEIAGEAGIGRDANDHVGFAEAMNTLWSNPDLRLLQREKALARATRFSWDYAAEQVWQVYRQVSEN